MEHAGKWQSIGQPQGWMMGLLTASLAEELLLVLPSMSRTAQVSGCLWQMLFASSVHYLWGAGWPLGPGANMQGDAFQIKLRGSPPRAWVMELFLTSPSPTTMHPLERKQLFTWLKSVGESSVRRPEGGVLLTFQQFGNKVNHLVRRVLLWGVDECPPFRKQKKRYLASGQLYCHDTWRTLIYFSSDLPIFVKKQKKRVND